MAARPLATSGPASGELLGTFPAPGVAAPKASLLSANSALNATTISVLSAPRANGLIAIDVGGLGCEIRRIVSVSGLVVTLNAGLKSAHTSGAVIYYFDGAADAAWWGAKGDQTADDEPPLQAAVRTISDGLLAQTMSTVPLSGAGRIYRIAKPLMLPNHCKLIDFNIWARSTFTPADNRGAAVMSFRGTARAFTATAVDDTFAATAHGLSNGAQIVVKGASLPAGVVAGKIYYLVSSATNSFKLSETFGGSPINLTTDGSGDYYGDCGAETRQYMRDVFIAGGGLAGVNGARFNLQQPSFFMNLRVSDCGGNCLMLAGQQAVFFNTELITGNIGLLLDGAKFMEFYGFDSELNLTAQIYVPSAGESVFGGGGAEGCLFAGVHMEYDAANKGIILHGICSTLTFDNFWVSCPAGYFLQATGDAGSIGYSLKDVRLSTTAGVVLIDDQAHGVTRTALHANDYIDQEVIQPTLQDGSQNDETRRVIRGQDQGYIRMGGLNPGAPRMTHRPDTAQTAPQEIWRDKSAVDQFWINVFGSPIIARTVEPDDAELAAGQSIPWLDKTNGAAKFNVKAKQADGTVKKGSLPLFQAADTGAQSTTAATQTTPWGFASQAQADAIATHLNDIRTALRNAGLMA